MKNCVIHKLVAGHKLSQRYFLDISKYRSALLIRNRGFASDVSELQFDKEFNPIKTLLTYPVENSHNVSAIRRNPE